MRKNGQGLVFQVGAACAMLAVMLQAGAAYGQVEEGQEARW